MNLRRMLVSVAFVVLGMLTSAGAASGQCKDCDEWHFCFTASSAGVYSDQCNYVPFVYCETYGTQCNIIGAPKLLDGQPSEVEFMRVDLPLSRFKKALGRAARKSDGDEFVVTAAGTLVIWGDSHGGKVPSGLTQMKMAPIMFDASTVETPPDASGFQALIASSKAIHPETKGFIFKIEVGTGPNRETIITLSGTGYESFVGRKLVVVVTGKTVRVVAQTERTWSMSTYLMSRRSRR